VTSYCAEKHGVLLWAKQRPRLTVTWSSWPVTYKQGARREINFKASSLATVNSAPTLLLPSTLDSAEYAGHAVNTLLHTFALERALPIPTSDLSSSILQCNSSTLHPPNLTNIISSALSTYAGISYMATTTTTQLAEF
jgi:hypothetical protein